jgi:hypothetical protein
MHFLTIDLVQDHQNTLLAEASRTRRGDRLARVERLRHRAEQAVRRAQRAYAQLSCFDDRRLING